jgi:hypothetical protein
MKDRMMDNVQNSDSYMDAKTNVFVYFGMSLRLGCQLHALGKELQYLMVRRNG